MSAVEARRWYRKKKTHPEEVVHPDRLDRVSKSGDIAAGAGVPQIHKVSTSFRLPDFGPIPFHLFNNRLNFLDESISTGWRPYSRVATTLGVASPVIGLNEGVRDTFDRQYSRSYTRLYSMPYNVPDYPKEFSYPTSYSGRKDTCPSLSSQTPLVPAPFHHLLLLAPPCLFSLYLLAHFNVPGANRDVLNRPGRDYKKVTDSDYRVKSYNRKVVKATE